MPDVGGVALVLIVNQGRALAGRCLGVDDGRTFEVFDVDEIRGVIGPCSCFRDDDGDSFADILHRLAGEGVSLRDAIHDRQRPVRRDGSHFIVTEVGRGENGDHTWLRPSCFGVDGNDVRVREGAADD